MIKIAEMLQKIPLIYLLTIGFVLGLVLFLPREMAETMSLLAFRVQYKVYIGPSFLVVLVFFFARLILSFQKRINKRKIENARYDTLLTLTPEEKGYLVPFIDQQINTIHVDVTDGIAGGLQRKGIIYLASSTFNILDGAPYNLQPWVREHLEHNGYLLDGYSGHPISPREKRGNRWY